VPTSGVCQPGEGRGLHAGVERAESGRVACGGCACSLARGSRHGKGLAGGAPSSGEVERGLSCVAVLVGFAGLCSWAVRRKEAPGRLGRVGLGLRDLVLCFSVLPISLPFSFSNLTQTNLNSNSYAFNQ